MKITKFNVPVLLIGIGMLLSSCVKDLRHIKGEGPVVSQNFYLPEVNGVALSIDANVYVAYGDSQTITIEGQQNIIDNIQKYVTADGLWQIGYFNPVRSHKGVSVYITTSRFDYATISGSGGIVTTDYFADSANVYLRISGSGSITMKTIAQTVQSEISGSGFIFLSGSAMENHIQISGSGSVKAFDLKTDNSYVTISGSGSSEVWAENLLNVVISGSGNVYYIGYPQINTTISGSGGVFDSNN